MPHIFITDSDFSTTDKTFEYLLGFQPSLGGIILVEDEISIFLDSRYFSKTENIDEENLKKILGKTDIKINYINYKGSLVDSITSEIKQVEEINIENNIAIKYYKQIKAKFPKVDIKLSENYFGKDRILKNEDEIKNIKKAVEIIDDTFIHIKKLANSGEIIGKTELELRAIIVSKILSLGSQGESFDTIVAFGENSASPHHSAGNTKICTGPLLIDMGALYNGYCSDFTRTIWVGEQTKAYQEFKQIYEIVKKSHEESIKNFKIGMTGCDIDKISRDYIVEKGYGDYYTHSLGHGIGLDVHEEPKISKTGNQKLENSMVFTIEPGIYLPGKFGVRLEDIVFLSKNKLEKHSKIEL